VEVLSFLRSEPDVYALTPGGEWTVRDAAVHLICGTRLHDTLIRGRPSRYRTAYDPSVSNAALFLAMDESQPTVLADLDEAAVASFIDALSRRGPHDPCQYADLSLTVGIIAAFQSFEYYLHGFDMAQAVGHKWACPEAATDSTLAVTGPVLLSGLDPEIAGDLKGSFAIEGQFGRICCDVHSGVTEALDADADTDCSIIGPSSKLLLWLTGRVGWEDAGLSASGMRPEIANSLTLARW
jgi:uncharacterized protein (TIGR03083 family)